MKAFLFLLGLILAFALAASASQHTAPSCVHTRSCASKDWSLVQRAHPSYLVKFIVPVKINNLEYLQAYVDRITNINDPDYAKVLTFEQIGQITRNQEAIDAATRFFDAQGVAYELTPNGDYFTVYSNVSVAERMLSTEFHIFHSKAHDKQIVRALRYTVPEEISNHVNFFYNVISFPVTLRPQPIFKAFEHGKEVAASGTVTPNLINQYYGIADNTVKNTNKVTQSLFEALGQSYSPTDLTTFQNKFNLPKQAINNVVGKNNPNECSSDPNNCAEANLDVQYLMAVAQQAPTTFWSIAGNGDIFSEWINAVATAADAPLVHSISYGSIETEEAPTELTQFDQEALKLGVRGITIMVSSGDDGVANFVARGDPSQCGFNPSFPATATNVLAVGATQGPESGTTEIACSSSTNGVITTGGGFSTVFQQPSYQADAVAKYYQTNVTFPPSSQYNKGGRGYPDVAFLGYDFQVVIAGQTYSVSGTSCSSPSFAGLVSLINDARASQGKNPVGIINQAIYQLAGSNSALFNDVTQGENNCCAGDPSTATCCQYGFYAAAGWDPLTGFGSAHFAKLLPAFVNLP